jgi:16S rRNA (cytidine1402-2'-O)-methyltransferase
MPGSLFVVSMSIGNPEDVTLRALRVLKDVDLIAAEDTRLAKAFLDRHAIATPITSYQNENQDEKVPVLIRRLEEGQRVALISDTGTPALADPGSSLISAALRAGIPVVPVPGPTAVMAALVASGLATDGFVFQGFLPKGARARQRVLETLRQERRTLVLFESPERVLSTLEAIRAAWGNRRIVLAQDLTKPGERFVRGTVNALLKALRPGSVKGEVTLVVQGKRRQESGAASGRTRDATRRRVSGS